MRFLRTSGLPLPVRPILGPSPHDVIWREADSARVRNIPQNPAYAGAYVYGRRQKNPSRCLSGSARGTIKVAVGDWAVCLQTAHPGYIGWEEFMANQRRMADNVNRYEAGHPAVPRRGSALLQGIAICGRCGRRMCLRYTGPNGDYPVYCCRVDRDQRASALCQEVRALPVDTLVERVLLNALAPDQIATRSRRWDNWRKRVGNLSGNGRSDENAPATRPSGRDGSTTLSSPKPTCGTLARTSLGCRPTKVGSKSVSASVPPENADEPSRNKAAGRQRIWKRLLPQVRL
jgi:Recombinase zinc beta ribbon domain/Recombinase